MKQLEVTHKQIGEAVFYIKPFPAFTAANISGDLAALLTPMLGSLAPLLADRDGKENTGFLDIELEDAMPALSKAFSSLSGDKFEKLMKKLLIDHKNISVECEATDGDVKILSYDLANEVFCGDVQDMYILCFEVIKLNFKGFFKRLGTRFGSLRGYMTEQVPSTENTEN